MKDSLKRLASYWGRLTTETQLSEYVTPADRQTFTRRTQAEGLTFLTVTLPRLFKSLDAAFASSKLIAPVGFKAKKNHAYPLFLVKAWEAIFNKDGSLKPVDQIQMGAVICIRQLSAIFYKLEMPHTETQISEVISSFLEAEEDLASLDLSDPYVVRILERAKGLVHRLLGGVNPLDIRPRHGSGSSACRVKPWERYSSFRYIPRLNEVYPYDEYFFYNKTHLVDRLGDLLNAEEAEPAARVVFVPKDSRGPRLISCEPREFMFIQQGLMAKLYESVRPYPAIARMISFTDQTRNQKLARIGSVDESLATIDLKEASDRVSLKLVKAIFPDNWFAALTACRSLSTTLPDGTNVPLDKFAPMGSACCFPVEAICFWAIALAAKPRDRDYLNSLFSRRITGRTKERQKCLTLAVYGDDIIVSTPETESVIQALELCGLLVNKDKSYWKGPFRESCGGDFLNGVNVTPVRLKHLPDNNNRSALRIADHFNQMIGNKHTEYPECLFHSLFQEWYGPVAISANWWTRLEDSRERTNRMRNSTDPNKNGKAFNGLALRGRYNSIPNAFKTRWNPMLQQREVRVLKESAIHREVNSDRWGQVLRREVEPSTFQPAHLCALAKRTRIKYGWIAL
jgi:hypothetical protein